MVENIIETHTEGGKGSKGGNRKQHPEQPQEEHEAATHGRYYSLFFIKRGDIFVTDPL
jgi:hypothetical protein